ncbi:MFS transporter, partial [Candidatus Poribacteria bacterium]|nr:MFS transporter [Candidatus Poribacteria bacterium]
GFLRTTFAALQFRDFRLFYTGQGLSLIGTWMRRTALGWFVYELTGSKALLGTIEALALLPMFLFSPLAGSLADRLDKRRMIIATQLLAFTSSSTLAVLIATGRVELWHLMTLAVIGGIAFAFEVPTRQAYVVELVGKRHLLNGIALNSALVNGARVIGPAAAGLIMGTIGVAMCFALDALSYLVVTGTLLSIRRRSKPPVKSSASHFAHVAEGIREAMSNRQVRTVLALLTLMGVFGWSFGTLMPAIAQDILHLSETKYGVLMAMFGIGAVAGAILVASQPPKAGSGHRAFAGVWMMSAGLLLFSVTRDFAAMGVFLAIAGFGGVWFVSTGNSLIQLSVADSMRGRIMGIWALGFGGSLPIGSFMAGWIAQAISPYATIRIFASALLVSSLLMFPRRGHAADRATEKKDKSGVPCAPVTASQRWR